MRLVVDTSTIIRGLLKRHSDPAYVVDQIANENYKLIMTDEMAKELTIAIFLLGRKNKLDVGLIKKYLRAVSVFTLSAERIVTTTVFNSCSDPNDKMFIECAIDGQAQYCISSDHSLFKIKEYCDDADELNLIKDIEFYNPEKFIDEVVKKVEKK